jgi:predicted site-specific integrase-resolvase
MHVGIVRIVGNIGLSEIKKEAAASVRGKGVVHIRTSSTQKRNDLERQGDRMVGAYADNEVVEVWID